MMKLTTVLLTMTLVLTSLHADAAKRLGGGRSFGKQSQNVTQREAVRPAPAQATPNASPNAAPSATPNAVPGAAAGAAAAPRRPWGAMLGGLAAGLGLAWLAHSLGFGAEFGQVLMFALFALILFMLFGLFMRRRAASASPYAYGGVGSSTNPNPMPQYNPAKVGNDASARPWEQQGASFDASTSARGGLRIGSSLAPSAPNWFIPPDFDVQGFVQAAKQNFIRLQAAWDRADIPELRAMMTDSMLHEIQTQLAERGRLVQGPNTTEVVMLEAQLLGIEDLGEGYMASVEFSGMIREEPNQAPNPFREVWNMTRPKTGQAGWLVAGVQALQ
jgi:predicted lipid-binding transport protein (Tim44 family)